LHLSKERSEKEDAPAPQNKCSHPEKHPIKSPSGTKTVSVPNGPVGFELRLDLNAIVLPFRSAFVGSTKKTKMMAICVIQVAAELEPYRLRVIRITLFPGTAQRKQDFALRRKSLRLS
jgi:hypothetical protein